MIIHNRATWKKTRYPFVMLIIFSFGFVTSFSEEAFAEEQTLPSWIRNIAVWWGEDKISDEDFINTFQYLVQNKILEIPPPEIIEPECGIGLVLNETSNECVIHDKSDTTGIFVEAIDDQKKAVASLIKTTALWWGQGKLVDEDFSNALQYLVENNVLVIEPEKPLVIQPQIKPKPEDLVIWPKIERIEDFTVQGHENVESYHLQFKLIDAQKRSLTPDGTLSIVLMDDRNRIIYLDAFSVRKANYVDSFSAFSENTDQGDKVYSWEIKTSDIKSGFTPYGKAKLAFTDRFGLQFFSEFDRIAIPQFS